MRPHLVTLAACLLAGPVLASGGGERRSAAVPLLPAYQQECAACHTAYPPGLLPARSWQRLVDNLPRHFGTDASLDAATVASLKVWLTANAADAAGTRRGGERDGRGTAAEPPQDRITRSAWFVREHRELPAGTFQNPKVRSAAQCGACHTKADIGDFNEHNVRIPR